MKIKGKENVCSLLYLLNIYHFWCSSFLPVNPNDIILSLQLKEFPWELLRPTGDKSSVFVHWKWLLLYFHRWRTVDLKIEFWVDVFFFFFFHHLKGICFLASIVWDDISVVTCVIILLYVMSFSGSFIFVFQHFDYDVLRYSFLSICATWGLLNLLNL